MFLLLIGSVGCGHMTVNHAEELRKNHDYGSIGTFMDTTDYKRLNTQTIFTCRTVESLRIMINR